ncbi:MAG: T9SS type A sorting domain-containing protein [Saprospiraceae bacterium]|nr:T9SS type A sorting domain-containing protein [Saprospiraceae bacterium]
MNCQYDDPSNCTIQNCYCPLDNSQVTSINTDYSSYMVDQAGCTLLGLCPGSGEWEIVENGYFETQTFFNFCGDLCGTCHYVTMCVFSLGTYITSEYSSPAQLECLENQPWCGQRAFITYFCDGQNVASHCDDNPIFSCPFFLTAEESGLKDFVDSLNVGQIFRLMQDSGLVSMETNLLLPEGFTPGTKAKVYTESIGNMGQQPLAFYNRNGCDGINCTGLVCHTDIPDPLGEGEQSAFIDDRSGFDYLITPNPSAGNFMLKIIRASAKNNHLDLNIRDVTGRIVLHRQYETVNTGDEFTLETQKLPPGMYMVVLEYSNGTRWVEKVIRI